MSKRDRHDSDRRGDRRDDRRDNQPDEEQQRRLGEADPQEGDSLTALKAILSKVAALLKPLQLTPDESIRLVEQLYGNVLETDVRLAGEADDTRKSSVLAQIQHATITREGGKIVVQYVAPEDIVPESQDASTTARPADAQAPSAETSAPSMRGQRPPSEAGLRPAGAQTPPAGPVTPPTGTRAVEEGDTTPEARTETDRKSGTSGRASGQRSPARSSGARTVRRPKTEQGEQTEAAEPATPTDAPAAAE